MSSPLAGRRVGLVLGASACVLLVLVAAYAARLVAAGTGARWRLDEAGANGLRPATLAYLEGAEGRLGLTYFVSSRRAMPSSLQRVEAEVMRLLLALKAAAPGKLDYRILDPDLAPDPALEPPLPPPPAGEEERAAKPVARAVSYASSHAASPVKVRRIVQDASSETAVWSSLVLSHADRPEGLLQGLTEADLPYLEELVVETWKANDAPSRPVVGIGGGPGKYDEVRSLCATNASADLLAFDPEREGGFPLKADLVLWIDPREPGRERALELEHYLSTGRSAIVAGSLASIQTLAKNGAPPGYRVARNPADWQGFLRPFGLSMKPLLLTDKLREAITWRERGGPVKDDSPFHLRIPPTLFDTRSFLGPNAGALLVTAVTPFEWDAAAVAATGRRLEVVANTSESTRALPLSEGDLAAAEIEGAPGVPKQPWIVLLKPEDPWKGDLLVVGTPTLFHDDIYAQGSNANATLLRTLLRTYTHPQRLARIRVARHLPPRAPELSRTARLLWRLAAVGLIPTILLGSVLVATRPRSVGRRGLSSWRLAALSVALVGACFLIARASSLLSRPQLDLTAEEANTVLPVTREKVARVRDGLGVELLASDGAHMPPPLKRVEPRVLGLLRRLGLGVSIVRPEELPQEEQRKLPPEGLRPFDVDYVLDDAPASARVWSALRLRRGDRTAVIPRVDARSVEHLEFLLAAACEKLEVGRAPVVGLLTDLPRLSPAEAHADYQQKGYTAPVGADVYSLARRLIEIHGYDVAYINPEAPVFPPRIDVLVWLQPRFPRRAWDQFGKYMLAGGKAVVALQHYNVQQRQYRGAGFQTVYWPQPQFHSFNEYLRLLGVEQVGDKQGEKPGEVLLDREHADLVIETQVNRSAFRENLPQQVARPFLLRIAGSQLAATSPITARLGSLLFVWGNRFTADPAALAKHGLELVPLATTSPRAWSYAWSGGWVPEKILAGPDGATGYFPAPQTLVCELRGQFPPVEMVKPQEGQETLQLAAAPPAGVTPAPGSLILIGSSEIFKNSHLEEPGYQHDQLLLNALAYQAHGPELAALQARVRAPRVFPRQEDATRGRWRTLALALPAGSVLGIGLLAFALRRRLVSGARSR